MHRLLQRRRTTLKTQSSVNKLIAKHMSKIGEFYNQFSNPDSPQSIIKLQVKEAMEIMLQS